MEQSAVVPAAGQADDHAALGLAAARKLFRSGVGATEVDDPLTREYAEAAIAELARLQRDEAPGSYREALDGAEASAEQFNIDPLQGVSEVIQNADDLGASTVRVALSGRPGHREELLVAHDGEPVRLAEAWSMVLPYLSTKRHNARAKGRFGIGLKTLIKLGAQLAVHSPPYHFAVEANLITPATPREAIPSVYGGDGGETLFIVPLPNDFDEATFHAWFENWGSPSLLFLDSVRQVEVYDIQAPSRLFSLEVEAVAASRKDLTLGRKRMGAETTVLSDRKDDREWVRLTTEFATPKGISRTRKATGDLTPVGVAFSAGGSDTRLFAGLPLRASSELPYDLNAQFDVDPSRGHVIQSLWNGWLLDRLPSFLAAAALARFKEEPHNGWQAVAVPPETAGGDDAWLSNRIATLVEEVASLVSTHLRLHIDGRNRKLQNLVYEEQALDGFLDQEDLKRLAPGHTAVIPEVRDAYGRWRVVLDALGASRSISVDEALGLVHTAVEDGRPDEWYVRLASLALQAGVEELLADMPCLRFADGTVATPKDACERHVVIVGQPIEAFGVASGITKVLSPAYEASQDERVIAWLHEQGVIREADTPDAVLAALVKRGESDPIGLDDQALLLLRDCLEHMEADHRRMLGPGIGVAVRVKAYDWKGSRKNRSMERPSDCYLPSGIDKEQDNWPRAAGRTPGLHWIDSGYAKLLRTGGNRDRLGAQAFFRLLGAEVAPRLQRAVADDTRYGYPATTINWRAVPTAQREAVRARAPRATHLQRDWRSPDLGLVIRDLMSESSRPKRKSRGLALVSVLNRAWSRLYAEHEEATAVHSDYTWRTAGTVPATWLALAASEPWLANQNGSLRSPRELVLRTPSNRRIYGDDRAVYAYGLGEEHARSPAVLGLEIKSNPRASALLDELERFRDSNDVEQTERVFALYELLADHVPTGELGPRAAVDDLDIAELRARFGSTPGEQGLVLAGRWLAPPDVLRGRPIFGSRRHFVAEAPRLLPLWRAVAVRAPTVRDALTVLREIARSPEESDRGVLIDTYRFLAHELNGMSQQERRSLRNLPLWIGSQWTRERPLYACSDTSFADALRQELPVWQPPCGLTTLGALPTALNVQVIDLDSLPVAGASAADAAAGEVVRPRVHRALGLLRDHLAEQDPVLYQSCAVPWRQFETIGVVMAPGLAVEVSVPGRPSLLVPRRAHLIRDPLTLLAADEEVLGSWDTGGLAIAGLFSAGDTDKVGLAWETMWNRAALGQEGKGVALAEPEPTKGSGLDALGDAAERARGRGTRKKQSRPKPATPESGGAADPPPPPRRLKSIAQLRVSRIDLQEGDVRPSGVKKSKRRGLSGDLPAPKSAGPNRRRGVIAYSPKEREDLAFDILRLVLGADDKEILDYTRARGIGADAVDQRRRSFEIKAAAGRPPDNVTLTANEAEHAFRDPENFFLVVVSGLEEGEDTDVRIVERPLETLDWKPQTNVTLSGVLKKPALRIRLLDDGAA